jgi:hypothetical protein
MDLFLRALDKETRELDENQVRVGLSGNRRIQPGTAAEHQESC